jgi:hypothetical protein
MSEHDELLKRSDYFRCNFLNVSMLKVRCAQRQTVGVQIDSSTRTIPDYCRDCDQGKKNIGSPVPGKKLEEELEMLNIKGICINCKRPDMQVDRTSHLCGSCRTICTGTKQDTPEREAALKKARDKYMGKLKMPRGRHKAQKKVEVPPPEKIRKGGRRPGSPAPGVVERAIQTVASKAIAGALLTANEQEIEKLKVFNEAIRKYLA